MRQTFEIVIESDGTTANEMLELLRDFGGGAIDLIKVREVTVTKQKKRGR